MCYAHAHGVRVVVHHDMAVSDLPNATARAVWINSTIQMTLDNFLDGVNVDIESPIAKGSPEVVGLSALLSELTPAMHKEVPGSRVTLDVAWNPACVDGRCYDYAGML
jgi:Di-N-acetylchitobiase